MFVNSPSRKAIIIILCTGHGSNIVSKLHVSDKPFLCDHRHIRFNIESDKIPTLEYRNPRDTDKGSYCEHLQYKHKNCPSGAGSSIELELMERRVLAAIISAFTASCHVKAKRFVGGPPWWNPKVSSLQAGTRMLFNRAKCTGE